MSRTAASTSGWRAMNCVEVTPLQDQEAAVIDGGDGRPAPRSLEQRHLAKEGAGLEKHRSARNLDLDPAGSDEVHAVRPIATTDHAGARRRRHRPEQHEKLVPVALLDLAEHRKGCEQGFEVQRPDAVALLGALPIGRQDPPRAPQAGRRRKARPTRVAPRSSAINPSAPFMTALFT